MTTIVQLFPNYYAASFHAVCQTIRQLILYSIVILEADRIVIILIIIL